MHFVIGIMRIQKCLAHKICHIKGSFNILYFICRFSMLWFVYQAEKEYVDIIEAVYPNYELYLELLNFFNESSQIARYQK